MSRDQDALPRPRGSSRRLSSHGQGAEQGPRRRRRDARATTNAGLRRPSRAWLLHAAGVAAAWCAASLELSWPARRTIPASTSAARSSRVERRHVPPESGRGAKAPSRSPTIHMRRAHEGTPLAPAQTHLLRPDAPKSARGRIAGGSSGLQDQGRDLVRVGEDREVAGVDLDRCRVHAVGKEALEFRGGGAISPRDGVPAWL